MIEKTKVPVSRACNILQVSRGSYYKWKNEGFIDYGDDYLKKEIEGIILEFPFYGYRRVKHELRRRKIIVNGKKVLRIMKRYNLICRSKKLFKPVTTQSDHDYRVYPNLIRDIKVTGLNQVWAADITYIRLLHEFIYLAAIIDIHSRKCVGWALSRDIDTILTLNALDMAISKRKYLGLNGLIHHSDRGVQYTSTNYVELLEKHGIKISMSRSGNPYDNAFMESFNKTLKVEEVYINEYETFEDAYKNINHFIDLVYNKKRIHSGIGYVTPEEFEMEVLAKI
jgi:transposase InsO family protein